MASETNPNPAKPGEELASGASRRTFLTGAGAAAAGVTAVAAGVLGAGPADAATRDNAAADDAESSEGIVAYISDPANGEITLMSGEREVTVTDHKLTRAFARKVR